MMFSLVGRRCACVTLQKFSLASVLGKSAAWIAILFLSLVVVSSISAADSNDAITRAKASLDTIGVLTPAHKSALEVILSGPEPPLERMVRGWSVVNRDVASAIENLPKRGAWRAWQAPALLQSSQPAPVWRASLATYLGRELARREYYEEAIGCLETGALGDSADPASHAFFLAISHYQLRQTDNAFAALAALTNVKDRPKRYDVLADAMRQELVGLKTETLVGVAHDMRDLRRQFALGRATDRLATKQKLVLDRLDEWIAKEQVKQQPTPTPNSSGGAKPADASRAVGGSSEGTVGSRNLKGVAAWGNLPEKQREQILQELDRDFPGHYRDAIEAYFRRLATDSNQPKP